MENEQDNIPVAEEIKSAKQPEVTEEELKEVSGKFPIEGITEKMLTESGISILQCEQLITYMRFCNQMLIIKADIVHKVMEAVARKEMNDAKIAGASEEDIAAMEEAIARRKAKPQTQNITGSFIAKDNDEVKPAT